MLWLNVISQLTPMNDEAICERLFSHTHINEWLINEVFMIMLIMMGWLKGYSQLYSNEW